MWAVTGWSRVGLIVLAPALIAGDQAYAPCCERILTRFELLRQPDPASCGPTCAAMILRYYGRDESTAWAEPSRLSRRLALMSPHGLQRLLIDGGVSAAVLRGEIADLITAIDSGRPAILLVRTDPLMWHYVVVIGYRGGAFLLADPYGRLAWVDETALDLSWSFDGVLEGRPVGRGLDRQPPDPIRRGLERLGLTPHLMILPDRPPDPSDTPRPPPARSNSLHVPLSDEPMDPPKPGLGSGPSLGTTIQPALL